jgi:hypothetical protein
MSTLKINTLSNLAGSQSTPVENAINGSAKAWVNFAGTGTVTIRAAYNVSSITDIGTGDYRVNFSASFADVSYSVFVTGTLQSSYTNTGDHYYSKLVSSVNVQHIENATVFDTPEMSVTVFR